MHPRRYGGNAERDRALMGRDKPTNPFYSKPETFVNFMTQAENAKSEEDASKVVDEFLSTLDKEQKEYDSYNQELYNKKLEQPQLEKLAEDIWTVFSFGSDKVGDEVPIVGEFLKADNARNVLLPDDHMFAWEVRKKLKNVNNALSQLTELIN